MLERQLHVAGISRGIYQGSAFYRQDGVWAQGARSGGLGSPLTLPASATADLGAEWAVRPGLALRLDVRNVTDARAYTAAVTRGGDGAVPLLVAWPAPAGTGGGAPS